MWDNRSTVYSQLLLYMKGESAISFAKEVLAFIDQAKKVNRNNLAPFIFTPKTMDLIERASLLKYNKYKGGIDLSKEIMFEVNDMDIDLDGVPDQWEGSSPENVKILINGMNLEVKNISSEKEANLVSRTLFFSSGKTYRIELAISENTEDAEIPYTISGVVEKGNFKKQQGNIYTSEFNTSPEFIQAENKLSISVRDKFVIKNFVITEK